jgi:hypothetical protein
LRGARIIAEFYFSATRKRNATIFPTASFSEIAGFPAKIPGFKEISAARKFEDHKIEDRRISHGDSRPQGGDSSAY